MDLETKSISSASPITERKEIFAFVSVQWAGRLHTHEICDFRTSPPMERFKSGLCLEKKGEVFLK